MFTSAQRLLGIALTGLLLTVACGQENPQDADCVGCVLRDQIEAAQPGETIHISAGTYTLSGGELLIDKDLVLVGAGSESTIIQAAVSLELATHRVMRITEGTIVSISGVTVRYGSETSTELRMIPFHSEAVGMISSGIEQMGAEFGGGIYTQGTLTIVDSVVTDNFSGGGGGIFNGAKIIIKNSSVSGNGSRGLGGGVFNGGILEATGLVANDNRSGSGAGISNWGQATLYGSTISGNHANYYGGGIQNHSVGSMTLDSSTVSNNRASISGGINNSELLEVSNSHVDDNTAGLGAGIDTSGTLTLSNTTVSGNTAQEGGGLLVRFIVREKGAVVSNTIITGNTADHGPDCMGVVDSLGGNLIGVSNGCDFMGLESDNVGSK
ncbi:MAG TPA: hypothetical protein EYQ67_00420 [Dehalococcoidia bacterium]|nr:hypothetical protein [Dehalococcoidia bacterium]